MLGYLGGWDFLNEGHYGAGDGFSNWLQPLHLVCIASLSFPIAYDAAEKELI